MFDALALLIQECLAFIGEIGVPGSTSISRMDTGIRAAEAYLDSVGAMSTAPNLAELAIDAWHGVREWPVGARAWVAYLVLERLDHSYERTPLCIVGLADDKLLLIGRRWWNAHYIETSNSAKPRSLPFTYGPQLRNVRIVDVPHSVYVDEAALLDLSENIRRTRRMRIGMSWGVMGVATRYKSYGRYGAPGTMGFASTDMDGLGTGLGADESVYRSGLRNIAAQAARDEIDVLMLPELCVCAEGRQLLVDELAALGVSCLVVPGSFHEDVPAVGGTVTRNAAHVIAIHATEATEVGVVYKSTGFDFPTENAEAVPGLDAVYAAAQSAACPTLREATPWFANAKAQIDELRIFQTRVGVFGVLICKDALDPALVAPLNEMLDHLLIVSLNASDKAWFVQDAGTGRARKDVATFYVNAWQATVLGGTDGLEMSFWRLPGGIVDPSLPREAVFRLPVHAAGAQEGVAPDHPLADKYHHQRVDAHARDSVFRGYSMPDTGWVVLEVPVPASLIG